MPVWVQFSRNHLENLGLVVIQGASLEGRAAVLLQEVHRHLRREPPPTSKWPWSKLRRCLEEAAQNLPAPLKDDIRAWASSADALYRERSRYVHSEWLLGSESDDGVGYVHVDRETGEPEIDQVHAVQLYDFQLRLGGAATKAMMLTKRVISLSGEQPAS